MRENSIRATFMCPQVQAKSTELSVFGITVRDPYGELKPRIENGRRLVEIGAVIVRGSRIDIVPKAGLSTGCLRTLFGAAERAFHTPPSKAGGWRYTREGKDPRWITWVTVPIDESVGLSESAGRSDCRPNRLVA